MSDLRVHKMRIFIYSMNKNLLISNISAPERLTLDVTSKLNEFYLTHFFVKFFSVSSNEFF